MHPQIQFQPQPVGYMPTPNQTQTMEVMTMPKSDNREALQDWFRSLFATFGEAPGTIIINSFVSYCGGLRISIPDFEDLYREERDRRIRAAFNGSNYSELAERFTNFKGERLSVRQIRYIIDGERRAR